MWRPIIVKKKKMKECVIIVDNSNIWIEGMKYSASLQGIVSTNGMEPCDYEWRVDFGKLLSKVSQGKAIRKAILVGSRPPVNDSLWNVAKRRGFEVIVQDRNSNNKEKAVDTELAVQGAKLVYTTEPAVLKILSGDADFKPLVDIANEQGWETEMWAFSSSISATMGMSVTRVKPLDDIFSQIGYVNKPKTRQIHRG